MYVGKLTVTQLVKDRNSVHRVTLVNTAPKTTSYRILSRADFSKTVFTLQLLQSMSTPCQW